MKKSILFMFVIVLGSVLLYSQTVTVNNPAPGSFHIRGSKLVIKWVNNQSTGNPRSVNLALFGRGKFGEVAVIADSTENNGKYEWLIPLTVASGEYFIKVRDLTKSKTYGNSMKFRILPETATPLRPRDPCLFTQDQRTDLVLDSLQVVSIQNGIAHIQVGIRNAGNRCIKEINLQMTFFFAPEPLIRVGSEYFSDGRDWLLKGGEKIIWIGTVIRPGIAKTNTLKVRVWPSPPHDYDQNSNIQNDDKSVKIVWEE